MPSTPSTPLPAPCPHQRFSPGYAAYGGDTPRFALGVCYPGDEPGLRCTLTGEACTAYPPDCPQWRPAQLVCPACLVFGERRAHKSTFRETPLLFREQAYMCPECYETYASALAVAQRAIAVLRDALDDAEYLEGVARGFHEEACGEEARNPFSYEALAHFLPKSLDIPVSIGNDSQ